MKKLLIFFTVILLFIRKFILYILIFIVIFYTYLFIVYSIRSGKFSEEKDIDKFIEKYKDESFSEFENMHIFCRSKTLLLFENDVYIIGDINNTVSWSVKYNFWKKEILSINYHPYKKAKLDSIYLTDEEIKKIILRFIDYGFYSLTVEDKNVYINHIENRSYLRLNDTIRKDTMIYMHYKDNWYINKNFNF